MRFLSRLLPLALLASALAVPAAQAQNHTTNITLTSLVNVPNAKVCASAVDQYGNPISFSEPGWGLIAKNAPPFCQITTSGALPSGLNVPDACHTNSPQQIQYAITIQPLSAGVASGQSVTLGPVPNVCTSTYSLDDYAPTTSVSSSIANVLGNGPSVPTSCVSPSIWFATVSGVTTAYGCSDGTYSPFSQLNTAVAGTTVGTFAAGNDARIVNSLKQHGTWSINTTYALNDVVTYIGTTYVSLTAGNIGSIPPTSTGAWSVLGSAVTPSTLNAVTGLTIPQNQFESKANIGFALSDLAAGCTNESHIVFISDSTLRGHGPLSAANYPINSLLAHTSKFCTHPGMIPILGDVSTGNPIPSDAFSLNGSGFTTDSLYGPSQTGVAAFGSNLFISGSNTVTMYPGPMYEYMHGDKVCVEGTTEPGDTGVAVTVDGTVVGTVGIYAGTTAPYYTCFSVPMAYHLSTVLSGVGHVALMGYMVGTAGLYLDNFAHGGARDDAWGANVATQLAYIAAMPVKPTVIVIALGINPSIQGAGNTVDSYTSNMTNITNWITTNLPGAQILIADEHAVAFPGTLLPQCCGPNSIQGVEQSIASAGGFHYTSFSNTAGTWAQANSRGIMAVDSVHGGDGMGVLTGQILSLSLFGSEFPDTTSYPADVVYTTDTAHVLGAWPADSAVRSTGTSYVFPATTVPGDERSLYNAGTSPQTLTGVAGPAEGTIVLPRETYNFKNWGASNYWEVKSSNRLPLGGTISAATAGTGAGTGGTAIVSGLDGSHELLVNTGTSPAVSPNPIATITYSASRGHTSYCTLTPISAAAAGLTGPTAPYISATSPTGYTLMAPPTALAPSTFYGWNVACP